MKATKLFGTCGILSVIWYILGYYIITFFNPNLLIVNTIFTPLMTFISLWLLDKKFDIIY